MHQYWSSTMIFPYRKLIKYDFCFWFMTNATYIKIIFNLYKSYAWWVKFKFFKKYILTHSNKYFVCVCVCVYVDLRIFIYAFLEIFKSSFKYLLAFFKSYFVFINRNKVDFLFCLQHMK